MCMQEGRKGDVHDPGNYTDITLLSTEIAGEGFRCNDQEKSRRVTSGKNSKVSIFYIFKIRCISNLEKLVWR